MAPIKHSLKVIEDLNSKVQSTDGFAALDQEDKKTKYIQAITTSPLADIEGLKADDFDKVNRQRLNEAKVLKVLASNKGSLDTYEFASALENENMSSGSAVIVVGNMLATGKIQMDANRVSLKSDTRSTDEIWKSFEREHSDELDSDFF